MEGDAKVMGTVCSSYFVIELLMRFAKMGVYQVTMTVYVVANQGGGVWAAGQPGARCEVSHTGKVKVTHTVP